ncbi:hypothetical protein PENANT_c119G03726 [Penicillium antarcticum]|uniref:Uncharacterized protein n=1 Tax=Penicillium antarcticum TaxID=416450 RepID=A0A1V6PIR3_9EURO|nr:hypothetical protein PENANT_c119G03726 [Penicillium antarcticum]
MAWDPLHLQRVLGQVLGDPLHHHPTSPSPIDRPTKRQRLVSQDREDLLSLDIRPQQSSNGIIIEPKIPVTHGTLTAEFIKLLRYNSTLATPALGLLDLYFCLWECYVVKSTEKIRLENKQR